jgi:hypothetical protein
MGRMFGRCYRSGIRGGHLEFRVELHPSPDKAVQMRFRVEDNMLMNLSAPQRQCSDVIAATLAIRGDCVSTSDSRAS